MSATRIALALALAVLGGCADRESSFVIEMRLGYSGLVRTGTESFAIVVFPCDDDLISRVQLTIDSVDAAGEVERLGVILTAEYDPPVSSRGVLISTAQDYVAESGVSRVVEDPEALRRFNEDESFLVKIDLDRYLSVHAWDETGEELMVGASARRRFEAGVGEVASSDYVGPIDSVYCWDGSQAWGG